MALHAPLLSDHESSVPVLVPCSVHPMTTVADVPLVAGVTEMIPHLSSAAVGSGVSSFVRRTGAL